MKLKSIERCAIGLAYEIAERGLSDADMIKGMIRNAFEACVIDFLKEYSGKEEQEYFNLIKQQGNHRIGSSKYIAMGYKLSAAKYQMKKANRVLNEINQDDMFVMLRHFVIDRYGEEVFQEFVEQAKKQRSFKEELLHKEATSSLYGMKELNEAEKAHQVLNSPTPADH